MSRVATSTVQRTPARPGFFIFGGQQSDDCRLFNAGGSTAFKAEDLPSGAGSLARVQVSCRYPGDITYLHACKSPARRARSHTFTRASRTVRSSIKGGSCLIDQNRKAPRAGPFHISGIEMAFTT